MGVYSPFLKKLLAYGQDPLCTMENGYNSNIQLCLTSMKNPKTSIGTTIAAGKSGGKSESPQSFV